MWGLKRGAPKRKPTATLIVWSSIRRPREEIGRTSNQAPDSFAEEASRRAHALGSGTDSKSLSVADVTVTQFRDFWRDRALAQGVGGCVPLTTVPLLHHSWEGVHHEDMSAQCSAQGRWRQQLRPKRLMVLIALHFFHSASVLGTTAHPSSGCM